MNEFLAHAALIVFTVTGTGVLIVGAAHFALATDPVGERKPQGSGRRAAERTRAE